MSNKQFIAPALVSLALVGGCGETSDNIQKRFDFKEHGSLVSYRQQIAKKTYDLVRCDPLITNQLKSIGGNGDHRSKQDYYFFVDTVASTVPGFALHSIREHNKGEKLKYQRMSFYSFNKGAIDFPKERVRLIKPGDTIKSHQAKCTIIDPKDLPQNDNI